MYNSLAFDALRDVVLFLDAVVAERTGGCLAVDRSAAFTAENTEEPRSQIRTVMCTGIRGTLNKTYVAPVRAVPARDTMGTGASRSIECDMAGEGAVIRGMAVVS